MNAEPTTLYLAAGALAVAGVAFIILVTGGRRRPDGAVEWAAVTISGLLVLAALGGGVWLAAGQLAGMLLLVPGGVLAALGIHFRRSLVLLPGATLLTLFGLLYPDHHPYHWPVIGYMEDIAAATLDDVRDFVDEMEGEARSVRIRVENSAAYQAVDDAQLKLEETEERLAATEAQIAGHALSVTNFSDTTDQIGPPADPAERAASAASQVPNGAVEGLNRTYDEIRAAIDEATGVFDVSIVDPVLRAGRQLERLLDRIDFLEGPLEVARSLLAPIQPILNAVDFILKLTVEPVIDAVVNGLGLDRLMREVTDEIRELLPDLDVFDPLLAELGRINDKAREVFDTAFGIFDDAGGANVVSAGDRFIPQTAAAASVKVNDRLIITRGGAQGHYRVLKVDGTGVWVGNVKAQVQLQYVSDDGSLFTYDVLSPTGGTPTIPFDLDENHWVYLDNDGGYDQTASKWLRVANVLRSAGGLQVVLEGGAAGTYADTTIVAGLADGLVDEAILLFRRPAGEDFPRSVLQNFDKGHTLYTNVLSETLVEGTTEIEAVGIGLVASVGDLLIFDAPGTLEPEEITSTGGDGTKFTVFIEEVLGPDRIRFAPVLPADLPDGLRYSLVRNSQEIVSATADAVTGAQITFNSWPLGVGDALGMGLEAGETITSGDIASAAADGDTTVLSLHPGAPDLAKVRPGDTITIAGTTTALDGTHVVLDADAAADAH